MNHSTPMDSFQISTPIYQIKGESFLLIFIIIFGILGLCVCFGLCESDDVNAISSVSQVDIVQELNDNKY